VNYQFTVCEEEAIGLYFPWCLNYLLHLLRGQRRKVVNELPCVLRIWYDETEGEIIRSNDLAAEIMSLNHLHTLYRLWTYPEIKCKTDRL